MVQCSTKSTIFSCFQGDVLCDIDNCINPWFTQSAGKETAPFRSVGFLIAQWSVIYRHLDLNPLCMHVCWGQNQWSDDHFSTIEMIHEHEHCFLMLLSYLYCFVFTCVRYVCMWKTSIVNRLKRWLDDILCFLCQRLRAFMSTSLVPRVLLRYSWLKTQLCSACAIFTV